MVGVDIKMIEMAIIFEIAETRAEAADLGNDYEPAGQSLPLLRRVNVFGRPGCNLRCRVIPTVNAANRVAEKSRDCRQVVPTIVPYPHLERWLRPRPRNTMYGFGYPHTFRSRGPSCSVDGTSRRPRPTSTASAGIPSSYNVAPSLCQDITNRIPAVGFEPTRGLPPRGF